MAVGSDLESNCGMLSGYFPMQYRCDDVRMNRSRPDTAIDESV